MENQENISLENWLCNQIIWHKKICADRPGNYRDSINKCHGLLSAGFPVEAWHCWKSEVMPSSKKHQKMKAFITECQRNNENHSRSDSHKFSFLSLRGCD